MDPLPLSPTDSLQSQQLVTGPGSALAFCWQVPRHVWLTLPAVGPALPGVLPRAPS